MTDPSGMLAMGMGGGPSLSCLAYLSLVPKSIKQECLICR